MTKNTAKKTSATVTRSAAKTTPAAPAVQGVPAEIGSYEGKPMIILRRHEGDKYPFQFQIGKARLIVQNMEAILQFVNNS